MNEKDFVIHLNQKKFDIDFDRLSFEVINLPYKKYSNVFNSNIHPLNKTTRWFNESETWQACDVDLESNTECNIFFLLLYNLLDCSFLRMNTCRALYQRRYTRLISHSHSRIPNQNHLCINFVVGENNSPITFEKYGDIDYTFALLNTIERHGVKPQKTNRFLIGMQFSYLDNFHTWEDVVNLIPLEYIK